MGIYIIPFGYTEPMQQCIIHQVTFSLTLLCLENGARGIYSHTAHISNTTTALRAVYIGMYIFDIGLHINPLYTQTLIYRDRQASFLLSTGI